MMKNKTYSTGQKTHEQSGDLLTYYFKNGNKKAEGRFVRETIEGEWIFYRETGQLWHLAILKRDRNTAHGSGMTKMMR